MAIEAAVPLKPLFEQSSQYRQVLEQSRREGRLREKTEIGDFRKLVYSKHGKSSILMQSFVSNKSYKRRG